ncbi:conserved hypothetical protein [Ricinus communis]|uniref:Uncharacterized protein n=1 Tax=Ricinus communis TaxID=3988 RepID=B9T9J8_RICCO|nr:conserved hypothetical protein [Ricinus communis]
MGARRLTKCLPDFRIRRDVRFCCAIAASRLRTLTTAPPGIAWIGALQRGGAPVCRGAELSCAAGFTRADGAWRGFHRPRTRRTRIEPRRS